MKLYDRQKGIINMKVRKGTRNYLHEAAMTETEMELCLERGAEVVRRCREEGSNILSFGEMGIGNTSSSSLWMSCFTGIPLKECVGAGSGLDDAGIRHKYEVLKQSLDEYGHKLVLDSLNAKPLLHLGLRLGEGTGAICAYPIIESAVRMINEMDNFAHASITKYF